MPHRLSWPVAHSCAACGMPPLLCPSYTTALLSASHATPIWRDGATSWTLGNGRSFFLQPGWSPAPHMHLFTDASGTLRYGAYFGGRWFSSTWLPDQQTCCITYKELYPITLVCSTWGHEWSSLRVEFHSDNQAVVSSLRKGSCRCSNVISLLRRLFLVAALQISVYLPLMSKVWLTASRIPSPARISTDFGHWLLKLQPSRTRHALFRASSGSPHLCRVLLRTATANPSDTQALRPWSVPLPHVLQHASTSTFASSRDLSTSQRTNHGQHQPSLLRAQEGRSPVTSTSNVGGTAAAGKRRMP